VMPETGSQVYRAAERRFWEHYGATPKEYFLHLAQPKVKVRMLEFGKGAPVLFVHGGPNACSSWAPLAAHLPDFRCLVLDRPGCGLSEPVDYTAADLRTLAVDLLSSVLDALEIEQAALVASSFGGAWAFWLAEAHPERVTRIVQEGTPALIAGMKVPLMMRWMAFPPAGRMMAKQRATAGSVQMTFRQLGHGASLAAGRFPAAWLDWSLHLMNDTDTMRSDLGAIWSVFTWRGVRPGFTYGEDFLRRVPQPTLFLWGEADPFGGVEVGRRACAAMPAASIESVPNAGHLPWLDDPAANAQVIRDFLRADQPQPAHQPPAQVPAMAAAS